jgi:hypothetical protein
MGNGSNLTRPSIKGSSISSLIEDIAKGVSDGSISEALIEQRLTEADRAVLDRPVNTAGWYDIHSYRRMAELLCEVEGRREDLMRERGAAAARRLMAAGVYQQMESVGRMRADREQSREGRLAAYQRGLRLIVTLSQSLLNFAQWKVAPCPGQADRLQIEVHDAADFPELLAYTCEGFMNAMADPKPNALLRPMWRYERISPDLIIYRMSRALDD